MGAVFLHIDQLAASFKRHDQKRVKTWAVDVVTPAPAFCILMLDDCLRSLAAIAIPIGAFMR
jgi:hypothetical protein